jgi:hypothetical protein
MSSAASPIDDIDELSQAPSHVSFLLRCWAGEGGHVRARVIAVNSGISYPLVDLSCLPGLLRALFAEAMPSALFSLDECDKASTNQDHEEGQP